MRKYHEYGDGFTIPGNILLLYLCIRIKIGVYNLIQIVCCSVFSGTNWYPYIH